MGMYNFVKKLLVASFLLQQSSTSATTNQLLRSRNFQQQKGLANSGDIRAFRRQQEASETTGNDYDSEMIASISDSVGQYWESEGIEALKKAVAIDSLSPSYNNNWMETGVYDEILDYYDSFAKSKLGNITKVTSVRYGKEVSGSDSPTPPMLLLTIEGSDKSNDENILAYMHADTQPHDVEDWTDGLHPLDAERETGKDVETGEEYDLLFGRGTTDDKYSFFTTIIAIQTLHDRGLDYPTVHIMEECEEESGSPNIVPYMHKALDDIGSPAPSAVFILDSGGVDNTRMWNNPTLRGIVSAFLTVEIADTTHHSGSYGGKIPSPYRLMNSLIAERIEDLKTGEIFGPEALLYEPSETNMRSAKERVELYVKDVVGGNWIDGASR